MTPCCPSRIQLEDYVSGRLDGNAHDAIDDHIDACVTCQAALETLDDLPAPVLACLRVAASGPAPAEEPELRQPASRAKALFSASSTGPVTPPAEGLRFAGRLTSYQSKKLLPAVVMRWCWAATCSCAARRGGGRVFKAYHRHCEAAGRREIAGTDCFARPTLPSLSTRSGSRGPPVASPYRRRA